jgi:hypothetical protein
LRKCVNALQGIGAFATTICQPFCHVVYYHGIAANFDGGFDATVTAKIAATVDANFAGTLPAHTAGYLGRQPFAATVDGSFDVKFARSLDGKFDASLL